MRTILLAGCLLGLGFAAPLAAQPWGEVPAYPVTRRAWDSEAPTTRAPLPWTTEAPRVFPEASAIPVAMTEELADTPPPSAVPPLPGPEAAPAKAGEGEYYTLDELKQEMKQLAWTKGDFKIVPYGTLWANMVYETHRTFIGDYTLYVLPNRANTEEQFHLDARSTRLGLDFSGPPVPLLACAPGGGKVEIDFQRLIDTENKPSVLLRHAYLEVKNEDFRLLAGQTWDVISPLYPGVLMYSVGWGGGNIGYRRAQLRGERYLALSDLSLLTLQGSLNTDIVTDNSPPSLAGDHAGWPVLEGRAGMTLGQRGPGFRPIEFGVSGHLGEQIYDFNPPFLNPVTGLARRTWSLNADFRVPISPRFGVQGEFFTGENLGSFLGGDVQGIDAGTPASPGTRRSIRSTGGWFDLWYDWTPSLHSHAGYSIDDPFDQDVTSGRVYNAFIFANLIYDLTSKFVVGVEITSWKTLWVGSSAGDANSVHCDFVAKYNF